MELWKTDGTVDGTVLLKDIFQGTGSSISGYLTGHFTKVGNEFFFLADDNLHGYELWKSDGTETGTVMVKDITAGNGSSTITSLTQVGSKIAFLVYDYSSKKNTLWQSDGTEEGTHAVNDVSLANVAITDYFGNALVGFNNQIYFAGYTQQYGSELWTGSLDGALPISLLAFTGELVTMDVRLSWTTTNELNFSYFNLQRSIDGIHFETISKIWAKGNTSGTTDYQYYDNDILALNTSNIYYRLEQVDKDGKSSPSKIIIININSKAVITASPNPFSTNLHLAIASTREQQILITATNSSGKMLFADTKKISEGKNTIDYSTLSWPGGIYFINIRFNDNSRSVIKVVKR